MLAAAALSLTFAVPLTPAAQSLASVQGFVSDATGASLPGVTIELVDLERGQRRTAFTNQAGYFVLRAVPSGAYDLVASLAGFRTTRRENVRLLVGQSLEVDLRLGLAGVAETVVVTAQAPLLEVGRTGVAGYVTEDEIANLPISGRDFVRFALLKPTVQVDARGRLSLSGQRAVNSGFTIDGADAKSAFFGFGRGGLAREGGGALVAQESVPLHRLPPSPRTGSEDHDPGRDGVHPARPPACAPARLPPHALLRPARESDAAPARGAVPTAPRHSVSDPAGRHPGVHRLSGSLSRPDRTVVAPLSPVSRRADAARRRPGRHRSSPRDSGFVCSRHASDDRIPIDGSRCGFVQPVFCLPSRR